MPDPEPYNTNVNRPPLRPRQHQVPAPAPAPRPNRRGVLWIIGLVAVFVVLSVCVISSHLGNTTTPAGNDNSVTTSIPDTPTPTPNPYPTLVTAYQGTVQNTTYGGTATLELTSIIQNQGEISGNVIIGPGLNGSGTFTGTIGSDGSVSFYDNTTDGSPDIDFSGSLNADGSLSGTYTAVTIFGSQGGNWQATPSS